jgi:GT2 family glycosyltransferase
VSASIAQAVPVITRDCTSQLRASVIVVNYNGKDYIGKCLTSVMSSISRDDEVLLVDNASADGSADYIERAFPEVRVVRNRDNVGFGQGSNVGACLANGRYLAFVNPDTVVEPGWLEALIGALEHAPDAALATSKILQLDDPERVSGCGNEMHYTGLTLGRGMGASRNAFEKVEEVPAISGACFCVAQDVFETLGGFDVDFFMYMEDADLSLRTRLAGYKILHVPQSVIYHDYTLHFGPKKTLYQERNRYLMLLKNLRWGTLLILLPAMLLAELVTWGFVLLRERKHLTNKLQAYAWVVTQWSDIIRKRQQVQTSRRTRDRDLVGQCTHRLAYEQTGSGPLAWLAHLVFDPLFFVFQRLALVLIWW